MTRSVLAAVVALAVLAGFPAAQQPQFRVGVQTVPVYATVTDRAGRLVPDLERGRGAEHTQDLIAVRVELLVRVAAERELPSPERSL